MVECARHLGGAFKQSGALFSLVNRLGAVSYELGPTQEVSWWAEKAAGSDVACSRGISTIAVETPRVVFPTKSWTGKEKLSSYHNMGSS